MFFSGSYGIGSFCIVYVDLPLLSFKYETNGKRRNSLVVHVQ